MGVYNNGTFGIAYITPIIPQNSIPKSIRIKVFEDIAIRKAHTRWKTKYTIVGTKIKLLKVPIKVEGNVALLIMRAICDLPMQCTSKLKSEITISWVPSL